MDLSLPPLSEGLSWGVVDMSRCDVLVDKAPGLVLISALVCTSLVVLVLLSIENFAP